MNADAELAPNASDMALRLTHDLLPWDSGEAIAELQEVLLAHGYKLPINGEFDWTTEAAVRAFQRQHSIRIDGIVGTKTWDQLMVTLKPGARPLRLGQRGADVLELQGLLQVCGYTVQRSGLFDLATQAAVIDFQTHHHLTTDGIVHDNTWLLLCNGRPLQRHARKTQWLLDHGRWKH